MKRYFAIFLCIGLLLQLTTINVVANESNMTIISNFIVPIENEMSTNEFAIQNKMPEAGADGFIIPVEGGMPEAGADGFIIPVEGGMPEAGENGFIAPISEVEPNAIPISTVEGLRSIEIGKSYYLTQNIDLSTYNNGIWKPLNFEKSDNNITLDGQGHKITNLNIPESEEQTYAGLFGEVECSLTIKNLGVEIKEGGSVSSPYNAGGLVGAGSITIENSYNTGSVSSPSGYAGGLVGSGYGNITIENSYNTGSVSSNYWLGGLVGGGSTITIENSYNTGSVSSKSKSNYEVGGLVGGGSTITIENSYNTGSVSSPSRAGGLVGDGKTITIENSYNTGSVSSTSGRAGGLVGSGYDVSITIENSYNTGSVSSKSNYAGGLVGSVYGSGSGSITIANSYNTGSVSSPSRAGGLVGDGDTITIENSYNTGSVSSTSEAGGLVGSGYDVSITIENSYNTGDVSSTSTNSTSSAGGLVGSGYNSGTITIENSYNTGDVSSTSTNSTSSAGGLVGSVYDSVDSVDSVSIIIENSYNTGDVSSSSSTSGRAGGLVGYGSNSDSITIENSYNTGDISSPNSAGGLVGYGSNSASITIENSYNTGSVSSPSRAGGLVGYGSNSASITIENSYNTGDVSSTSTSGISGGLVGSGDTITIENSYNTGSVSSTSSYTGGLVGYVNGTVTFYPTCRYSAKSLKPVGYAKKIVGLENVLPMISPDNGGNDNNNNNNSNNIEIEIDNRKSKDVGNLVIKADIVKEKDDLIEYSGNVTINDILKLNGTLTLNTQTFEIKGNGKLYAEASKSFKNDNSGLNITLYEGSFSLDADLAEFLQDKGINTFKLDGFDCEITKLKIENKAIRITGKINTDYIDDILIKDGEIFYSGELNIPKDINSHLITATEDSNPQINITSEIKEFYNSNIFEFTANLENVADGNIQINGRTVISKFGIGSDIKSVFIKLSLTDGKNNILINLESPTGATAIKELTIFVDTTPPQIRVEEIKGNPSNINEYIIIGEVEPSVKFLVNDVDYTDSVSELGNFSVVTALDDVGKIIMKTIDSVDNSTTLISNLKEENDNKLQLKETIDKGKETLTNELSTSADLVKSISDIAKSIKNLMSK